MKVIRNCKNVEKTDVFGVPLYVYTILIIQQPFAVFITVRSLRLRLKTNGDHLLEHT